MTHTYEPGLVLFDCVHGLENEARIARLALQEGYMPKDKEGQTAFNILDTQGMAAYLKHCEQVNPELLSMLAEEATDYLQQFAPQGHTIGFNENLDFGVWEDEDTGL